MLLEMEQFDAVTAAGDRLAMAGLTAVAFHEPKRLRDEAGRIRAQARRLSAEPPTRSGLTDREALVAYGRAMVAEIIAGRVLEDVS